MFTGIVQQLGAVAAFERNEVGAALSIDPLGWSHAPAPSESIAVNGCCLTVAAAGADGLRFDVIGQTLRMTALDDLAAGDPVNLEHAVAPGGLLGGHIVHGHVDGVGVVRRVRKEPAEWRLRIEPPGELLDAIVARGSVAVDGVSLTVADVGESWFEVALIPTTLRLTTLGRAEPGRRVNLETDYVARVVVHWLRRHHARPRGG